VKAIVFREGSQWAVEDSEKPQVGHGEALLRVIQTGVCGTDEHLLHGGFIAKFPLIPGHEIVGEVKDVDAVNGTGGRFGKDSNVVDNTVLCGECNACREGKDLFCERFGSLGCNMPGGFAEYVVVRASKLYPIGNLDPDVAVFAEPTACAVHGVDILDLAPASDVLIFGAGPTGLILSQLLRTAGAARVTVAAPTAAKLEVAQALGANHTVQISRVDPGASEAELREIAPTGFDAVIEATGSTAVLELAISLTKTGGTVLVYGLAAEDATASIKPYEIFSRELTIRGSFAQAHCIGRALFALQTGSVRTEGLITSKVALGEFERAIANLHDSSEIKTIVVPDYLV
jgi:D-arabinitol dehydrogenase (NADP+)